VLHFYTASTTELRQTAASTGISGLGELLQQVSAAEKTRDTEEGVSSYQKSII